MTSSAVLGRFSASDSADDTALKMVIRIESDGREPLLRSFAPNVDVVVGREESCHLVLPSIHVSRRHLTLHFDGAGFRIADASSGGTKVGSERLLCKERHFDSGPLSLFVGPYRLTVYGSRAAVQSIELRRALFNELLEKLNLGRRKAGLPVTDELRREVRQALEGLVAEDRWQVPCKHRPQLVTELENEALGLGPLESLLADPQVSEIMVVDADTIYAERRGSLELTGRRFTDAEAVRSAIERIVTPLGRRIDESSPLVDARLADGSRVNAVIPPLALRGPCITIRKFPSRRLTMDDLVRGGSLSDRMARFLERTVRLKKNVVISGGTGSGKTTLLNVLSRYIGDSERVVTIEDAAELSLAQPHVVGLESKPPNLEGKGEYTIRDLVKNALRMRPDRIVVGECRGGEALDMLQAMNTGHEGSMTTTHANSPAQAVARLETLCMMAGLDLPLFAIRRQIATSVHLVLQQSRLSDGRRRITSIAEVCGMDDDGQVILRELFSFDARSDEHAASGFSPSFLGELVTAGTPTEGSPF